MPQGQQAKGPGAEGGALENLASVNCSLNSMSYDFFQCMWLSVYKLQPSQKNIPLPFVRASNGFLRINSS